MIMSGQKEFQDNDSVRTCALKKFMMEQLQVLVQKQKVDSMAILFFIIIVNKNKYRVFFYPVKTNAHQHMYCTSGNVLASPPQLSGKGNGSAIPKS